MCDLLLAVVVGSILFPVPNRHITKESCDRISEVKSLREIEAILGGKAGDYRTGPTRSCFPECVSTCFEGEPLTIFRWEGDQARIEVWVDSKVKKRCTGYTLMCPERLGLIRTLLWRCQTWQRANYSRLLPFWRYSLAPR
jgi:hypothetical protein